MLCSYVQQFDMITCLSLNGRKSVNLRSFLMKMFIGYVLSLYMNANTSKPKLWNTLNGIPIRKQHRTNAHPHSPQQPRAQTFVYTVANHTRHSEIFYQMLQLFINVFPLSYFSYVRAMRCTYIYLCMVSGESAPLFMGLLLCYIQQQSLC